MIRGDHKKKIEEWQGETVLLTFAIPGGAGATSVEKATIVRVYPSFLLCLDEQGREQVYVTDKILGWEKFDSVAKNHYDQYNRLISPSGSEEVPKKDPGIRKVLDIKE